MKNYLIFIVSFILLYTVFQVLSGVILTYLYTADFSSLDGNPSQEVLFGKTAFMSSLITTIIATIAYFLSQKMFKTPEK